MAAKAKNRAQHDEVLSQNEVGETAAIFSSNTTCNTCDIENKNEALLKDAWEVVIKSPTPSSQDDTSVATTQNDILKTTNEKDFSTGTTQDDISTAKNQDDISKTTNENDISTLANQLIITMQDSNNSDQDHINENKFETNSECPTDLENVNLPTYEPISKNEIERENGTLHGQLENTNETDDSKEGKMFASPQQQQNNKLERRRPSVRNDVSQETNESNDKTTTDITSFKIEGGAEVSKDKDTSTNIFDNDPYSGLTSLQLLQLPVNDTCMVASHDQASHQHTLPVSVAQINARVAACGSAESPPCTPVESAAVQLAPIPSLHVEECSAAAGSISECTALTLNVSSQNLTDEKIEKQSLNFDPKNEVIECLLASAYHAEGSCQFNEAKRMYETQSENYQGKKNTLFDTQ